MMRALTQSHNLTAEYQIQGTIGTIIGQRMIRVSFGCLLGMLASAWWRSNRGCSRIQHEEYHAANAKSGAGGNAA